jgi:CubicO group peptidase (beta-lactamase class C family)
MNELSLNQIREMIHQSLEFWKTPGAAVTIITEDNLSLCEGFGVRNLDQRSPVTENTLFPIASSSKAFTAMSVGLLVDAGEVKWDTPVREILPTFRLQDNIASERLAVRDLLTHRSGLPRHDLVWYGSKFTRQEIFDRLRYLEPTRDIRTDFQYQNIMYMVAGCLVEKISDTSWENFVKEQIFDPIGMLNSNFSTIHTQATDNHAKPHKEKKGQLKEIPFFHADGENDAVGPAGSIISSASEMTAWMKLHLSTGIHGDKQFISSVNLEEMHKPQMVMRNMPFWAERMGLELGSYGLGWMVHAYKGNSLVHHGGHIDGFSILVSFIPKRKIGVIVLSNLDHSFIPEVVTFNIYDTLLNLKPTDWNARFKPIYDEIKAAADRTKGKSSADRKPDTAPSHPIEAYLGEFENPAYGIISVQKIGEGLQLVLNEKLTWPLEHYHYDTFEGYFAEFDLPLKAVFHTDLRGNISNVSLPLQPETDDILFERLPDPSLTDPTQMVRFTGVYELPLRSLTIILKGARLTASIPGFPEYTLLPYQGKEFEVQGLPGYSIEFKADQEGKIVEAIFSQPGAVLVAKRKGMRGS